MTAIAPARPALRPASPDDLAASAAVWRDALNDYLGRLNQPRIPDELGPILRLLGHLLTSDPERFWVAERDGEIVAFVAAVERDALWFLSMLFVRPSLQAGGLGRALLERVLPRADENRVLATATDSAQPISNALYSTYGIAPRLPLLGLIGRVDRPDAFGPLPSGITAEAFGAGPGEALDQALARLVDELDAEVGGFAHPQDHAFLRSERRRAFLYRGPDGRTLGYGYASEVGRVGPVVVRDDALLAPVLGHLLDAVPPRGASAVWVPGSADRALVALLRAGLRLDGFPVLLCWSRDFADFGRYVPNSPGLL